MTRTIENYKNGIRKVKEKFFNSGACQCYKDCNCIDSKGWSEWSEPFFKLGKRRFSTLEKANKAYEKDQINKQRNIIQREEALSWFLNLEKKEFNSIFHKLKIELKKDDVSINIRRLNWDILTEDYIYQIHRILIKRKLI